MVVVRLLDRFDVSSGGEAVYVPASARRLVALLALRGSPVERSYASQCLWMDKTEARAQANLRSVIWRLSRCSSPLVLLSSSHLSLRRDIEVDIDTVRGLARSLVDESRTVELDGLDAGSLSGELLPGWCDDFVELERERLRQIRLHALEALAQRLLRAGRHALALDAALAAVAADPLRETAHRAVIEIHLAEDNLGEALRQFASLVDLLARELGTAPSRRTAELLVLQPPLTTMAGQRA
ncbi:BTAD domain-containing putative transcriptional regulator [Streptomyces sp. SID13031]|uniref:AfsR/SARP family transcriptional regulator n=1 Tax=Streptomyces sp. SID13031 TaxID=2706046 RepID=UPI0013CBEA4B|nr:BTAD domain-containing putative transcriptional regulator [Streptomyces sp. SID13031]NEA30698.1 SARP family transcriptional regulator [Streptomyces sp. SID13031]